MSIPGGTSRRRVAVIGGGIGGLAAALHLRELDPTAELTLLEAGPRLGGVLHSERSGDFLLEHGADSFITNMPFAVDLCRRIGFDGQLISTNSASRRAFVVRRGRLRPVPDGFALMAPARIWPVLATPMLSPLGKMRLACERLVPRRRDNGDESLADFARRRLGREAFDRLVQPLVAGIYTADPERLSLAATLPRFQEMERRFGSLIRAARSERSGDGQHNAQASGARYSLFMTPRDGLGSLVAAITARLPAESVRLNTTVDEIQRVGDKWHLALKQGADASQPDKVTVPDALHFDAVIVALPAPVAARALRTVNVPLADELGAIEYAGAAVVSLAYRREQISHPLNGAGFVVPMIERRRILSASFSSVKYPGRAPDGTALIRVFIGGACQSELLSESDDGLVRIAAQELGQLLGVSGAAAKQRCPLAGVDAAISFRTFGSRGANRSPNGRTTWPGSGRQRIPRRRHSAGDPQRRGGRGASAGPRGNLRAGFRVACRTRSWIRQNSAAIVFGSWNSGESRYASSPLSSSSRSSQFES